MGIAVEVIVQPGESIQSAVNNTTSGDVIIVKPGNYTESIIISTQDLTIRSESGNPEDTIITADNSNVNVFHIRANNTTVSGFKVRSAQYSDVTGIYLGGSNYCTISNNDLSENHLGLYLSSSKKNNITDNKMNLNKKYGIQLMHSGGNILSNNSADSNHHGIILENNCSDNDLIGNIVSSNAGYGFYLINSSSNNLENNTISRNDMGIYLTNSNFSMISGNNISENIRYGMWISHSNYSAISGNTISESNWGIHLNSSDNGTYSGNILSFNYASGLSMCPACDHNTIFNNYLNNTFNVEVGNKRNTWNTEKKAGTNIVGGPYLGGNFWASPGGTGFSQTAPDKDENGIADVKYNGTNFTDNLPLVPVSDPEQAFPVADPSTDLTIHDIDFTNSATDSSSSGKDLTDSSKDLESSGADSKNSNDELTNSGTDLTDTAVSKTDKSDKASVPVENSSEDDNDTEKTDSRKN